MTISREAEVPDEVAQLMAVYSRCSDGVDAYTVLNASCQMLACSVGYIARERGFTLSETEKFTSHMSDLLMKSVTDNYGREPQAGDIEVKPS